MTTWLLMLLLTSVQTPTAASPTSAMPKIGSPAPAIAFAGEVLASAAVAGTSRPPASAITLESLRGQVVVLDFFATWCAPCVASIPRTNALIEALKDLPVVVLAVANEDRAPLERLVTDRPMRARLVLDDNGRTYKNYWITGLPFVVIIDPQGRVARFTHPEQITRDMIEQALARK